MAGYGVAGLNIPTDSFGGVAANAGAYGVVGGSASALGGGRHHILPHKPTWLYLAESSPGLIWS